MAAIDYTTTVAYGDGLGSVTFTNQIRIVNDAAQSAFFGKKGDSGSVVVDSSNNVVGLYFAGNSTGTVGVANQIATVLAALDVSVCTGIKKWEKEFAKELTPDKWLKNEKLEIKEIEVKERLKDFIKEWKEYAYEKFDWEGKFDFEGHDPWERFPRERFPGVVTPPGGRSAARRSSPARSAAGVVRWPPAERGRNRAASISRRLPVGPAANPFVAPPFVAHVLDHLGAPLPATQVVNWGSFTGLNAGWTMEIKLDGKCPTVQATLVHFAQPATMEAYNSDGTLAGTATMTPTQMVAQTLTIEGTAIAHVRITSPQDETILLGLCCCADTKCKGRDEEKPFLADHKSVIKDKDKDKEFKEPKEFKEFKEPKEFKEREKDIKEPKEFKEIREGGFEHFIPPSMRPDLGQGALRREPDGGGRARLRRHPG